MISEDQYMNEAEALKRMNNNKKLFRRLLGMFLQGKEYAALDECLAAEDYDKAADQAHAIKGVTGNLSLTLLYNYSTDLMQQLRNGPPDPATLSGYREALSATRERVESIIARLDSEAG